MGTPGGPNEPDSEHNIFAAKPNHPAPHKKNMSNDELPSYQDPYAGYDQIGLEDNKDDGGGFPNAANDIGLSNDFNNNFGDLFNTNNTGAVG